MEGQRTVWAVTAEKLRYFQEMMYCSPCWTWGRGGGGGGAWQAGGKMVTGQQGLEGSRSILNWVQMEWSQKGIPQENRGNGHKSQFGRLSLGVRKVFPQKEHQNRPQGRRNHHPGGWGLRLSSAKPLLSWPHMGNCPAPSRRLGWKPPEDPSNQCFYNVMSYHLCEIKWDAFGRGRMQESTGHEEEEK